MGEPELILISTGSEVGLAVQAYDKLTAAGRNVRVVSMPCTSVFEAQETADYKQSVLPLQGRARIAIEAAHADYWYKYVGLEGRVIGMTTYGESAPAPALFEGLVSPWKTSWVRLKSCWKLNGVPCQSRLVVARELAPAGLRSGPSRAIEMCQIHLVSRSGVLRTPGGGRASLATQASSCKGLCRPQCENPMPQPRPYKVALNGYGRIGRCVLRALFERGRGGRV